MPEPNDRFTIPNSEYVKQSFVVKRIVGDVVIAYDENEKLGNRLAWPISYGFNQLYLRERAKWGERNERTEMDPGN